MMTSLATGHAPANESSDVDGPLYDAPTPKPIPIGQNYSYRGSSELLKRIVRSLDAETIRNIVDGDPLLAIVDDAIDPLVAEKMSATLLTAEWGGYSAETGADHIGTLKDFNSLFECFEDTACSDYFDRAIHCMPALTRALAPYDNPAESILHHLETAWVVAGFTVVDSDFRPHRGKIEFCHPEYIPQSDSIADSFDAALCKLLNSDLPVTMSPLADGPFAYVMIGNCIRFKCTSAYPKSVRDVGPIRIRRLVAIGGRLQVRFGLG